MSIVVVKMKNLNLTCAVVFCAVYLGISGCSVLQACETSACADDSRITADVKSKLNSVSELAFDQIEVQTVDRVVYLHGPVDSRMESDRAEQLAHVPGVAKVSNDLYERQ